MELIIHFIEDRKIMTRQALMEPKGTSDSTPIPNDFGPLVKTFKPSQMIILGGRPAMGKTSVALDFAHQASVLSDETTLFFSLEMERGEVVQKILSSHSYTESEKDIKDANLIIDDSPALNLFNLRTKCLNQKARPEGLDLVIIDSLQLMEMPKISDTNSRKKAMSDISHGIKLLAKELECPVVIISQLGRDLENRLDKTPRISDLRESSSLEQDSDVILLAHRPECDNPTDNPNRVQLIIAKNRSGATQTV